MSEQEFEPNQNPITVLATALASATAKDLPAIVKEQFGEPVRPNIEDVTVDMFLQSWRSSLMGFSGTVKNNRFVDAYTIVISVEDTYCVYFDGKLAYTVATPSIAFKSALSARLLHGQKLAVHKYFAELPDD